MLSWPTRARPKFVAERPERSSIQLEDQPKADRIHAPEVRQRVSTAARSEVAAGAGVQFRSAFVRASAIGDSRRKDCIGGQPLLVAGATLWTSRSEPSGGPGWRDGLEMLSHFGRSTLDALRALQFAVEGSHEDRYAQQPDPELGRLAIDIRSAFHNAAARIHRWRFDMAAPTINLEQAIADLEDRMDAVRHAGLRFSQAEIPAPEADCPSPAGHPRRDQPSRG